MCQQRFVYFHDALNHHVGVNFHEITAVPTVREIQVSRKGDTMQGDLDMGGYEGRETNTQRIYRWQLEASTDDVNFVTLFSAPNPTYNCYRLLCLEAEPSNPGLTYMQLFIYSD